ncbi:MAG: hypothetical protein II825_03605 [Paludibacteraceae bacterium]|nr:hypothetical protein [Paludibacteraceae bacterium]
MKATELMLGDWVYAKVQVDDTGTEPVFERTPKRVTDLTNSINGIYVEGTSQFAGAEIEPIPLTPEILELNNFQKDPDYIDTYWRPDCRKFCFVKENDDWYFAFRHKGGHICIAECNYVHKLQHDLKRCGIEKEIVL